MMQLKVVGWVAWIALAIALYLLAQKNGWIGTTATTATTTTPATT